MGIRSFVRIIVSLVGALIPLVFLSGSFSPLGSYLPNVLGKESGIYSSLQGAVGVSIPVGDSSGWSSGRDRANTLSSRSTSPGQHKRRNILESQDRSFKDAQLAARRDALDEHAWHCTEKPPARHHEFTVHDSLNVPQWTEKAQERREDSFNGQEIGGD